MEKIHFYTIALILGLLPAWPSSADEACGCAAIELRSGQAGPTNSSVYCTSNSLDIESGCTNWGLGQQGCDSDQYAYQCPLGSVSVQNTDLQRVGWNFEIAVTLTDGSDASECDHGQIATRTATIDDEKQTNPSAEKYPAAADVVFEQGPDVEIVAEPDPYPYYGSSNSDDEALFGADGYTEETAQSNLDFNDGAPEITWLDTPDFQWDLDADEEGAVDFEFMSWTDGAEEENNCWCRFTIQRTWDGSQAGGVGFTFVAGYNCALAQ